MPRVTNKSVMVTNVLGTAAAGRATVAEAKPQARGAATTMAATTGTIAASPAALTRPISAGGRLKTKIGVIVGPTLPTSVITAALATAQLQIVARPRPRGEIKVPISPTAKITADTIFQDPDAASGKKYYIPSFTLAEQVLDGTRRLRATMRPVDEGWLLTVFFTSGARKGGTEAIQTSFTPFLCFTTLTLSKELELVLEKEDPTTWKASLFLGTVDELEEVYTALKKLEYRTQFILRCKFRAAVPVPKQKRGDEQLYKPGSHSVDVALNRDPFVFDPQLHPYIFAGVTNVSERTPDVKLFPVEWQGKDHHYYREENRPHVFYYLPDAFKVTRRPEPPYTPNMLVRFASEDGTREKMRASLEYVAAPVVDPERLESAAGALKKHLPSPMPAGVTAPVFQPLVVKDVDQLRLTLAIPRAGASGTPRQERPGVVSSLTDSFVDEIADMTLSNFQDVFDALFGKSAVVFSGQVLVVGGGQRVDEPLDFSARLEDLYGPVLEETETPNADGTVGLTLRNGSESPVIVRSIPAEISAGDKVLAAHVENLTRDGQRVALPVELAPGQALELTVVADQPDAVSGAPDAIFNLDDVEVRPDPGAVWAAILDASVPAEYTRAIQVMGFSEWFAPTTDVLAIAVDFENGDSVVLRADNLEAEGHVRVPVSDLVLRKAQESEYRYTQVTVRQSGQTRTQKSDHLDALFPEASS
jgi:hypothetical protein